MERRKAEQRLTVHNSRHDTNPEEYYNPLNELMQKEQYGHLKPVYNDLRTHLPHLGNYQELARETISYERVRQSGPPPSPK
ncbi:Hypothetical protein CINCED_3A014718 [Cinara cedri]|uniref:Uncharacterized protein n=1 Tax=Cinara cedri TaxID=506608 RepID=A0A5E4N581_9HEMI|nr:Hypothetical protein CINCED_3A014718 [Cinara cedri]